MHMIPFGHKTCLKIDLESIIESKILPMIDFEFSDRFRALVDTLSKAVYLLQSMKINACWLNRSNSRSEKNTCTMK